MSILPSGRICPYLPDAFIKSTRVLKNLEWTNSLICYHKSALKHFDSKYNTFIKGNPENINIQIGGENSNLSNTHGLDTNNYQAYYEMKSDHGWQELYNLIDTLNNFPDSISNILNIDRVLWMHAFNYTLINFDSYVGYAQNYYLYRDLSRLFRSK